METGLQIFTAIAAAIGALGGFAKLLEVWQDRGGVKLRVSLTSVPDGDVLVAHMGIYVSCRRRPVTVTAAGINLPGLGGITRTFEDVALTEGQTHVFNIPLHKIQQALAENPWVGKPDYAYAEAGGKRYKSRLGSTEVFWITGKAPRGLRGIWSRLLSKLIPSRRMRAEAFAQRLSKSMKVEDAPSNAADG